MTFPEQGTPPNPSKQATQKKDGDSDGGGIRQWLIDTYNGLYVIVLKPRMPESILYAMAILGVLLGIIWAYTAAGVQWTGGNPNRLNEGSQEQWLLMVAVGLHPNVNYQFTDAQRLLLAVPNPSAQIDRMLTELDPASSDAIALRALQEQLQETDDFDANSAQAIKRGNPILNFLWAWIFPIIIIVILVVVITLLWRFLIYDNLVAPIVQRFAEMRDPELAARNQRARDDIKRMQEERELRLKLSKEASGSELGDPVMTQLSIYTPGRSFDESYEIELESGEFLGQSGAVISEAVDPDPVAIEVWLFDMFTSKNIAKVFITPQGNADPAIRSKIEADVDNPASDIIVAETGKPLTIDTDKLRLEAKFANLEINANGRFENFNLQMRAWNKDSASSSAPPPAPVSPVAAPDMSTYDDIQFDPPPPMPSSGSSASPAGAPDMSTYDDIQFDPPPPMPSSSGSRSTPAGAPDMSTYDDIQFDPPPPMPSSGISSPPPMTPLSPPPLSPYGDDDEDDDPFGGTGDFTPLGGS